MTLRTIVILVFLSSSAACVLFGFGEGSVWIKMTQPYEPSHAGNTLLGFSCLHGNNPYHLENTGFAGQVLLFSGLAVSGLDMYLVRPIYAFLASFLAPLTGIIPAMALTNLLGWALAVFVVWRFTRLAFEDDLAAAVAAIFASGGFGFVAHMGDYGAHLLSFTVYYLGVYVIYASNVWRERRGFWTHLGLGIFLAICCLQYNTGLSLVAGYACLSVFHNRWRDVAAGLFVALTAQRLWVLVLQVMLPLSDKSLSGIDFYGTESSYLALSLAQWTRAAQSPQLFVTTFITELCRFLSFDSPPTVAAGLAALFLARSRAGFGRFSIAMAVFPFVAGLLYSQHAQARGYLVYGISILIYAALGAVGADVLRRPAGVVKRAVVWGALAALITCHFAWSYAAFAGNVGPLKYYFLGGKANLAMALSPPEIMSLTGVEAPPRLFGGTSTLADAGAATVTDETKLHRPSISVTLTGLALRGFIGLYFVLLTWVLFRGARRRAAVGWGLAVGVILILLPLVAGPALIRKAPVFFMIHGRQLPRQFKEISYYADIGAGALRRIGSLDPAAIKSEIHFAGPGANFTRLSIFIDDHEIRADRGRAGLWAIPTVELQESLKAGGRLLVTAAAANGESTYTGWQRNPLPARTIVIDGQPVSGEDLAVLPALELRFRNHRGALVLATF